LNIQLYHKLVKNPTLLNKETLSEIEDLVKNFPMVENFRILLALNLLILDDHRYESAITDAAIYSSDRKRLKEWVDYILDSINKKEENKEIQVERIEFEKSPHELSKETEEEVDSDISLKNETKAETSVEEYTEQSKEEQEIAAEQVKEEPQKDIPVQNDDSESEDLESEKKNIRSKKELLKLVRKRLNEIEAEKLAAGQPNKEEDEKEMKAKLIDRFIKQEPSISRPDKNEFYDPQSEAIESSIDEDDFFVTETLAQIHIQQGNLKKAQEIYRKLILKNPEKSSYFAAQIEKLTKK